MLIADVRVETRNLFVPFKCENLFLHGVQIFIHTYIHIHSTDPVPASIASEYGTCRYTSDNTRH